MPDIDAEPRFTTLVGGHRRASCAGPQAFFYDLARPPGARLRHSVRLGRAYMSSFSWTPFTIERLLILRAQGLMHSSIAAELGTTPSTIEHKLRRLRSQKPA